MKIAIDGPAGSGKSTVAKLLAEKLNFVYIDSGALYRACAYIGLQAGLDLQQSRKLVELLAGRLSVKTNGNSNSKTGFQVFCDQTDITSGLRTPELARAVSEVAPLAEVREFITGFIQDSFSEVNLVADGRDIGTVVFPKAELKIYLTASVEERARRRAGEHLERGETVDLDQIQQEISLRDKRDMERSLAPLKKAVDAFEIDTSDLSIDQVVEKIIELIP